jgi:hypothetical protein
LGNLGNQVLAREYQLSLSTEADIISTQRGSEYRKERIMTLKIWEPISIVRSALVAGMFCGPWVGFEQAPQHLQAGSLPRDRTPAGPKYGTRHDHPDAGCPVVDTSVLFISYNEQPRTFYLTLTGFALFTIALLVTVLVEVPIVKQIVLRPSWVLASSWAKQSSNGTRNGFFQSPMLY